MHQNNAFEIFLKNGKNYYIACNLNKREKILKLIITNIKNFHKCINNSFIINNNVENENKKENIINNIYEIQNENSIKNDNMIFIRDFSNLFQENSSKNKKNNFLENIFKIKKQKKSKLYIGSIFDEKLMLEKSYEHWTYNDIFISYDIKYIIRSHI